MRLSEKDIIQIKEKNLCEEDIKKQVDNFKHGFPYLSIKKAATTDSGIIKLSKKAIKKHIEHFENSEKEILKFVPASGAASRMFKFLFEYLTKDKTSKELEKFFTNIHKFAFYKDLKTILRANGKNIEDLLSQKQYSEILKFLLTPTGLNYGNLPKGLLKFHNYENHDRTSLEEHLVEGANYAKCSNSTSKIHLTVSEVHKDMFRALINKVKNKYENEYQVKYNIEFSQQKPSTDIVAVDINNNLFRNKDNTLYFRPGGHGALIENLNDINADIIFIKNIDNVIPDKYKEETYKYKKALAGILLEYQKTIFDYIEKLNNSADIKIAELEKF
ncbi:MAG: DUF4301 family protein, partial [Bacteroidota bacterium]|nr:DUF4301 family protein [Bacteroidota bacterium]